MLDNALRVTTEDERRAVRNLIQMGLLAPDNEPPVALMRDADGVVWRTGLPEGYDKTTLLLACLTCSLIAFGIGFTLAILIFR
jgi:hypothetical protein